MARDVPDYDAFAARARELTRGIPAEFLEGIEDVVVHREVKRHPLLPEIVTLGEQEPSPLAHMTQVDATPDGALVRSIVHLYYGSFVDLARRDPRFDLDAELRETIEHEVQHHLEDRAGVHGLIDEDELFDAYERFRAGLDHPRGFWRRGERLEPGVFAVGDDVFVELPLQRREVEARRGKVVTLQVLGEPFEAELPADAEPGDILTFEGEGLAPDDGEEGDAGDLHLVLDRRR